MSQEQEHNECTEREAKLLKRDITLGHPGLPNEVLESIVQFIPDPRDFKTFLFTLPCCMRTNAMNALSDFMSDKTKGFRGAHATAAWPKVVLNDYSQYFMLHEKWIEILPMRPQFHLDYGLSGKSAMVLPPEYMLPFVRSCKFTIFSSGLPHYKSKLLTKFLSQCGSLDTLELIIQDYGRSRATLWLQELLRGINHPQLRHFCYDSRIRYTLDIEFAQDILTWLTKGMAETLMLKNVDLGLRNNLQLGEDICEAISNAPNLKKLGLIDVNYFSAGVLYGRSLPATIEWFEWDKYSYEDNAEILQNLVAALMNVRCLKHLDCSFLESLIQKLELVPSFQLLQAIKIRSFPFNGLSCCMFNLLPRFACLETLTIEDPDFVGLNLACVLPSCQQLKTINISHNRYRDDTMKGFLYAIATCPSVRSANLSHHRCTRKGLLDLVPEITKCADHLNELWINANRRKRRERVAFFKALSAQNHPRLAIVPSFSYDMTKNECKKELQTLRTLRLLQSPSKQDYCLVHF